MKTLLKIGAVSWLLALCIWMLSVLFSTWPVPPFGLPYESIVRVLTLVIILPMIMALVITAITILWEDNLND